MEVLTVGHGYIKDVSKLLADGAEVKENYTTIAGMRCREYVIGKRFRILKTTQNHARAVLFEWDRQHGWEKTPLVYHACVFLYSLVRFRDDVFKHEIKNKAQEDTEKTE